MSSLFVHEGRSVPYVQLWSSERSVPARLTQRVTGTGIPFLAYADETPYDRDQHQALWVRFGMAPGRGEPDFVSLHPLRQRRAVTRGLCQVCARRLPPPDEQPPLYLLAHAAGRPIEEGERTQAAPLCPPCAGRALRECPPLRRGAVAARVQQPRPWGIAGLPYRLDTLQPLTHDLVEVPYASETVRLMVARRAVVSLHGITPVDITTLLDTPRTAPPAAHP